MATNSGGKWVKFAHILPSFIALAFRNGLEDRNADARGLNGNDIA